MAVNPLARTGEQNTLKMSDLLRIPVRDRVTAAKTDSSFIQMILNSLTPIEVAKAFPSYYRDAIPDVSNFVTKNIEAKLAGGGMSWNQTRGGYQGTARPGYTGEAETSSTARPAGTPQPTLEEMKKNLLKRGIDVDNIYSSIGTGILANDKRVKYLQKLSDDELKNAGLQRTETEEGKTLIKRMESKYDTMSDEDLKKLARTSGPVDRLVPNKKGFVNQDQLYAALVQRFSNSTLNGFVPSDGEAFGVKTGSPQEWARLALALGKQESSLHVKPGNGYRGGMYQFREDDLKRYGVSGNVYDPNVQIEAMAKQWEKFIPKSGAIAGRGNGAGTYGGYRGGAAYFEPLRHPEQLAKHWESVDKTHQAYQPPTTGTTDESPEEIRRRLKAQEQQQFANALVKETYELESPTSSSGTKVSYEDSSEQFKITGNMKGVDPRLAEIAKIAAEEFPLRVRLFSGKRNDGAHAKGLAVDTQLFDEAGVPIASYQTPQSANIYALWAEKMREVQQRLYPELDDEFVWGGAFSGLESGKYGAADWMDFRIGKHNGVTPENMQSYQFGKGFTNPNYVADAENDFLGIGNRPVTLDDLKLLEGFRLSKEQQEIQRRIAVAGGFNSGLLNQPNIGERKLEGPQIVQEETEQTASSSINSMIIPNTLNPNLPGGEEAMAGKEELAGVVFHKTSLTLEKLQKGEDPRAPTFGYNTAIVSTYQDESGNKITEQEWKKLPKSQKSLYTEQAEVHQIRPENVRPNQIRKTSDPDTPRSKEIGTELNNTNALGIVTIGSDSAAKQDATRKYLAELIATGKMSEDALNSVYGHGEIQNDDGRPFMDPKKTPEGSVMAKAVRENVEEIKQIAEEMKKDASIATAAMEEEAPEMALGGFIPEKDNLSVVNARGDTLAKINEGELNGGIRADGTGLRVVSNKTRIADDIVERNTTPAPTEQPEPQQQEKPVEQKNQVMNDDQQWRESSMIDTSYSAGTQVRAFRRSKFMPEGYHFNRATPGSLA